MNPDRVADIQTRFAPVLEPLANAYAYLMRTRANLYTRETLPAWRPPAPCISVGNISWGGTGKTPVVSWILDWAIQQGITPAVLTRGYGSHPPKRPYMVDIDSPAYEAGDEPLLLKLNHPEAHVVVDSNRVRGGKAISAANGPGLFVLDDGFQHLRVQRDINLCLFSPTDLDQQWNHVLPAGTWREDRSALNRADAFLINRMFGEEDCLDPLARIQLIHLGKPIYFFQVVAQHIVNLRSGQMSDCLKGERFLLVTGIGNPKKVLATCKRDLDELPVHHLSFPDHHPFSAADWQTIVERAERARCTRILCTPKDAVKLAPFADERLWVPHLSTSFTAYDSMTFDQWLAQRLDAARSSHG
ncbi:MAG: tetraacyldisaccharide 4'-kinase [Desulfovibrionales bacterium]|nr:tetraacyldisaccharide 4'-kinase [Desulfovibrionales bacterium]